MQVLRRMGVVLTFVSAVALVLSVIVLSLTDENSPTNGPYYVFFAVGLIMLMIGLKDWAILEPTPEVTYFHNVFGKAPEPGPKPNIWFGWVLPAVFIVSGYSALGYLSIIYTHDGFFSEAELVSYQIKEMLSFIAFVLSGTALAGYLLEQYFDSKREPTPSDPAPVEADEPQYNLYPQPADPSEPQFKLYGQPDGS